jgi:hypothetical protein
VTGGSSPVPPADPGPPGGGRSDGGAPAAVEITRELTLGRDLYLNDHRLDGTPVLPLSMAAELMAEAAAAVFPDWPVAEVRRLRLLRAVALPNGAKPICLVATPRPAESGAREVDVEIAEAGAGAPSCRGTVVFRGGLPEGPRWDGLALDTLRPFPMSAAEMYRTLLFHGPRLQCIAEVTGIAAHALIAQVRPSTPGACLASAQRLDWRLDPVLVDAAPQLLVVWARLTLGAAALPSGIRSVRRYRAPAGAGPLSCHFRVDPSSTGHTVVADAYFLDPDRRVVLAVEGLESGGHPVDRAAR